MEGVRDVDDMVMSALRYVLQGTLFILNPASTDTNS